MAAPALDIRDDRVGLGILMMLGTWLFFAVTDTTVKWLVLAGIPALQLAFLRYAVALTVSVGVGLSRGSVAGLHSRGDMALVVVRGSLLVMTTILNFIALKYLPLTVTATIANSSPILVTALAVPLLGERVGPWRWFAVVLGFIGVVIVIRPFGAEFHWATLLVLGNATGLALFSILTRKLSGRIATQTMQVAAGTVGTVVLAPFALAAWTSPDTLLGWILMFGIGVSAWAGTRNLLARARPCRGGRADALLLCLHPLRHHRGLHRLRHRPGQSDPRRRGDHHRVGPPDLVAGATAMTRVLCLGEVMVELSLDAADPTQATVGVAGDTYNTAVYLKRSAPKLDVAYATRLGRDRFSTMIRERLADEDISDALVTESDDRLPGLYAISTDAGGERSFLYWRDRSAYRTFFDAPGPDVDAMAAFDVIYHSAISIAVLPDEARHRFLDWLATYREGGGCVVFDSNYRPRLWPDAETARADIERAWRTCDIGLPSVDDEVSLYGDGDAQGVIDRLSAWGVGSGALKRGEKGPLSLSGATCPACPPAARVVDSTAAGDSFNGGYLGARLTGASEAEALAAGHALASQVVQHRGAILPRGEDT